MRRSAKVAMAGAFLLVGSLAAGLSGTAIGMIQAFNTGATSGEDSNAELSEAVGSSLRLTALLLPLAFIGLCLLVGGIIACCRVPQSGDATPR